MVEKFERKKVSASQLQGCMCAWRDCPAVFDGAMPTGWNWLLMYWGKHPARILAAIPPDDCARDAVLCPQHSFELELTLKELGRKLDATPPAGSA